MTTFIYKARDKRGLMLSGTLEGPSAATIKEALASQGLFPVSVQPQGFDLSLNHLFRRKVRAKDLVNFTRQFQVMFAAGSPMDRILRTLERQCKHEGLKEVLTKIHHDISGGSRLADAFSKHPDYFNHLYTSMLAVGEIGGVLDKTLKGMTDILSKEDRIKAKIKSATLYPKLVIGALVVVAVLMLIFVIPVFSEFYAGYGAKLPLPTRILVAMSEAVTHYWHVTLVGAIAAFIGWRKFKKSERGKNLMCTLQFKMPVFGNLNLLAANARFGHLVAALYRSGLPLTRTLEVVGETIDNVHYSKMVQEVKSDLDQGKSLSASMEDKPFFSPMMKETAAVGEQTGKLDEMLEGTAVFYDEEIDDLLKNLTTILEPILLFMIFGMVGFLALAVYMPVWNLSRVVTPSG